MNLNKRKYLMKPFVKLQFNYCPLIWKFKSRKPNNLINMMQEQALMFVCQDNSSLAELLEKDNSVHRAIILNRSNNS